MSISGLSLGLGLTSRSGLYGPTSQLDTSLSNLNTPSALGATPSLSGSPYAAPPSASLSGSLPASGGGADMLGMITQILSMVLSIISQLIGGGNSPATASNNPATTGNEGSAGNTGNSGNTGNAGNAGNANPGKNDTPPPVTKSTTTPASGSNKAGASGSANLDRWDSQIEAASKATGVPANYIKATMNAESSGDPNSVSNNPAGDHQDFSLMQTSNQNFADVMTRQPNAPKGLNAQNPNDNILMGAWTLKDNLEKSNGDFRQASLLYVGTGNTGYADSVVSNMNKLNAGQPLSG